MWLEKDISQALIAALCDVPPSFVYRVIKESFTVDQRIAKKARIQRAAQTEKRVAPPSWYTGPGRSVPLKVIEYCEEMDITEIPNDMTVITLPGGMLKLFPKEAAKLYNELNTLIKGSHRED